MNGEIASLSLKPLLMRLLRDQFPDGATGKQIANYVAEDRGTSKGAVAVALSELKSDNEITLEMGLWKFFTER